MKKIFIYLSIFSFIFAQKIQINPQFLYSYKSDSEDYSFRNSSVNDMEIGMFINYSNNNLNIDSYNGYHLIKGPNNSYSDFTPTTGLDWVKRDPGLGKNIRNYYIADMSFQYGDSVFSIYINKTSKHWGFGKRSLTISNKVPSFPHLGFYMPLSSMFKFEYFHGSLQSNIDDSNYNNYYTAGKNKQISRNIVAHRLKIKPSNFINIILNELVIYSNRSIEWTYLMPFIPFFPLQNYLNDIDNIIMSIDFEYILNIHKRIYISFLIDEWSPIYTFTKKNHNWFGYQIGFEYKNLYSKQDQLLIEYVWTDHRIYHHRFSSNDVYSWGYPLGFWAGPHAQELILKYKFTFYNREFDIFASNTKRGEYTSSMRTLQYHGEQNDVAYQRFGDNSSICEDCIGTTESKYKFSISVLNNINSNLNLNLKYTYIYWINSGFNPQLPVADIGLPNIVKNSLSLDINYKFY